MKSLFKHSSAIANPYSRRGWLIVSLALSLCNLGYWAQPAQAEGSRSLYPNGATGNRANTEWATNLYGPSAPVNNSLRRRTLLKVYANQGEYILLGSSAVGVGSGNILVYNPGRVTGRVGNENIPGTSDFSCNAQRTVTGNTAQGKITSRVMELAGPQSITGGNNATGYVPCYYQAPSTGIYDVVVYGTSGDGVASTATPLGELNLASAGNFSATNQGTSIAAWDVTIRSSTTTSTTDLNGRLFTYYLSLFTGGNSRPINSSIFPVTTDGYRYRTDLRGLDPNGFLVYGNNQGFLDSDGQTPLYHDVLGDSAQLTNVQGGVNFALPNFPIFFNAADNQVLNTLSIPLIPITPSVSNPTFTGTAGGNSSNQNSGGTFNFNSSVTGTYEITISINGTNFDPTFSQNRVLRGVMATSGSQSVSWDGKDNSGNFFPVGTNYQFRVSIHAGEYHFPIIDAEASTGGPTFNLLNATNSLGNTRGFYDDRGYRTLNGTNVGTPGTVLCTGSGSTPSPAFSDPNTGFDTSSNQRAFGPASNTNTSCGGSFGDAKGIDIWTYLPSAAQTSNLNIVAPDLTITKTHTGNFIRGSTGTYTLAVTNSGTAATSGTVTVSDTLPASLTPTAASGTGWNCTISGQTVTCTRSDPLASSANYPVISITVAVSQSAPSSLTNTATVSGGGETNTSNDSVNDPTTVDSSADLSITKTDNQTSTIPGSPISYTITVTNNGPSTVNSLTVADTVPSTIQNPVFTPSTGSYNSSTGAWTGLNLATGQSVILTLSGTVSSTATGTITNTATVAPPTGVNDSDNSNNSSTDTTTVNQPTDLSITKTDSPDPVNAGADLIYTIALTNNGPNTANNVTMSDPLPSGTTFQSITPPSGWICTTPAVGSNGTVSCTNPSFAVSTANFTVVVKVDPNTANGTTLNNTATVSSSTADTNTGNNSSSQATAVQQSADLRLSKVSNPANPAVGDTFDYTITVTNDGPSTATNVKVKDELPIGIGYVLNNPSQGTYDSITTKVWSVGTLNPGASATLTIRAIRNIASSTVNTAEVIAADQPDPDSPHNNQVSGEDDQDSATVPNQSVDLQVTKTVSNPTPSVGQNVTFTVTVANNSASVTATGVGLTDVLPAGLTYQSDTPSKGTYDNNTGVWSVGTLNPGATATLTITATVTTSGAKTNTAQLSALDQNDPNSGNNIGSATVTLSAVSPHMSLVKRITAINGTPVSGFDGTATDPNDNGNTSEDANWPTPLATYLRGQINGGLVKPGDEVEYTIYFLNSQNSATNITICDRVPDHQTLVQTGYNDAVPHPTAPGALAADTGIALAFDGTTLPTAPTVYLTNVNDGDKGRYYPANDPQTPSSCGSNTNGAVVVDIVTSPTTLPKATAPGTPPNSYGFIRFKAKVN